MQNDLPDPVLELFDDWNPVFWRRLRHDLAGAGGGAGPRLAHRERIPEFYCGVGVHPGAAGCEYGHLHRFVAGRAAGALVATLGVVLPSFVIILLVAAVLRSVLRYAGVQAVLDGVRPCVVAMILATAVTMGLSTLGGYTAGPAGGFAPDGRAIAVFVLLGLVHCGYKKIRQKAPSPIGMILLSAVLGIVFWH